MRRRGEWRGRRRHEVEREEEVCVSQCVCRQKNIDRLVPDTSPGGSLFQLLCIISFLAPPL